MNAFFEGDRPPLTREEVKQASWLLDCSRQDLLQVLYPVSSVRGSIEGILQHVAQAEHWYFQNIGLEQTALPEDSRVALDRVRAQTQAWSPALEGDHRIFGRRGEQWSARKVIRRTLWHERDHIQHMAGTMASLPKE